jgi:hypothetical protein
MNPWLIIYIVKTVFSIVQSLITMHKQSSRDALRCVASDGIIQTAQNKLNNKEVGK